MKFPSYFVSYVLLITGATLGYYFAKEDIRRDLETKYKPARRRNFSQHSSLVLFLSVACAAFPLLAIGGAIFGEKPLKWPSDFVAFLTLAAAVVISYFGYTQDVRTK